MPLPSSQRNRSAAQVLDAYAAAVRAEMTTAESVAPRLPRFLFVGNVSGASRQPSRWRRWLGWRGSFRSPTLLAREPLAGCSTPPTNRYNT